MALDHMSGSVPGGRVAYVMSWFPAPTETFILHEMLELRRRGLEIDVFPLFGAAPGPRHAGTDEMLARTRYHRALSLEVLAAQLFWLVTRPLPYLRAWARAILGNLGSPAFLVRAVAVVPRAAFIAREVAARGHAHVHAHWATHPTLAALVVKELTGIGFSFTAHAHDLYLDRAMLDEKIRDARFVVTISEFNRTLIRDLYGAEAARKTSVIRCGVDPSSFRPRAEGPRDDVPLVACVAGLRDYKGQRWLVEACARLRDRGVRFRCVLVGEGPERPHLARRIRELSLAEVELAGALPQDRVRDLLSRAAVVVHPSVTTAAGMMDGIPVALMEAMATGCAVVSTRVSGIPELVEDGRSGLLVEQRDADALADALGRLLADRELAARLGRAGREVVVRRFSIEANGAALLAAFARTAGVSRAPAATHPLRGDIVVTRRSAEPLAGRNVAVNVARGASERGDRAGAAGAPAGGDVARPEREPPG
jgi:glycosyltransferase involved in cell wall biosynthesis